MATSTETLIKAQAHWYWFQQKKTELESERDSVRNQKIGGIAYKLILILVIIQDTALDAMYDVVFGAGIGMLGTVLLIPVGAALMMLAVLFKFAFLVLVFLSISMFFQMKGVRLGSKVLVGAIIIVLLELCPVLNVLPWATIAFLAKVFVENKARKNRLFEILTNLAEVIERLKHPKISK